jgi:peroxiredoxin
MFKQCISASLFFALSLVACKQAKKNSLKVSVTYSNADKLVALDSSGNSHGVSKAYLEQIVYGKEQAPVVIDSAKLGAKDGSFELTANAAGESIFELVFGDNLLDIPLVNDVQHISITTDLSKKNDFYTVTGSDASSQIQTLIGAVGKKNYEIEKTFVQLDSLKRINASDSLQLPLTATKNAQISDLNDYLKQFLSSSSNATLSVLALSWASRSFSTGEFDSALSVAARKFPANPFLSDMKKSFDAQQSAPAEQSSGASSWVGKSVPELVLPDVNGKDISLASFKGKYLLVDFWASWCGPCRNENPNVVKAYNNYKGKNFTILGVSLDRDKDSWQKAIQQDHLTWTHVSDLKYWNSKAVEIFGFQGIPFNILVDPSGKVIAQELRGEDLENKLKEVLQ